MFINNQNRDNLKRLSNGCKDLGTKVNTNQACHACNKGCKNSSIPAQMAKTLVCTSKLYQIPTGSLEQHVEMGLWNKMPMLNKSKGKIYLNNKEDP